MESLSAAPATPSFAASIRYSRAQSDRLILESSLGRTSASDASTAAIDDLSKSLSIKAQKVIEKLNELLKAELPEGIEGLNPEDVTPEATADRIVSGVLGFFEVYAKQNPDLEGEELLSNFMEEVRKGVQTGYDEAFDILEELGAFEFSGVQEGIERTKILIEEKLQAFERQKRSELGLESESTGAVADEIQTELLQQAGKSIAVIA